jgi:hypothetical protein
LFEGLEKVVVVRAFKLGCCGCGVWEWLKLYVELVRVRVSWDRIYYD